MRGRLFFLIALAAIVVCLSVMFFGCRRNSPEKHLALAEQYLAEQRYGEAINEFFEVMVDEPKNERVYTGIIEAMLAEDRVIDAVAQYQTMLKVLPDNIDGYLGLGALYEVQGQNEQAKALYRQLIDTHPRDPAGYIRLGQLLKTQEDLLGAQQIYLELIAAVPTEPIGYIEAGLYYFNNRQYYAAVAILADGVRITGDERLSETYSSISSYVSIDWQDAYFETVIRNYLDRPDGIITLNDIDEITSIEINGNSALRYGMNTERLSVIEINGVEQPTVRGEMSSLFDLSHFANLTELTVNFMPVEDVTPIGTLINLKFLSLSNTNIRNVRALASLQSLTELRLEYGNIRDIGALGSLKNLEVLMLNDNDIRDLEALKNLEKLKTLDLSYNSIREAAPLVLLSNLRSLDIRNNYYISDEEVLDAMTYCDILR
jgi:tetratricopeptide (TPR) repeat protein